MLFGPTFLLSRNSLVFCSTKPAKNDQYGINLYAGSGLPQGPFLENNSFALKVGLRWVFVNLLKRVQKWLRTGFLGPKVGQNGSKPTFLPT